MSDSQYPAGMADAVAKFAQQELGTTATQISNNLMTVGAQSPDQAAVVQRQASILGVPPDTVRQDPDLARQQLLTRSVDPYNLQQVAPHLARFLTSPSNTAISHDDIPNLAGVEGSVQRLPAPTNPAPQLDPGAPPPTILGAFGQGLGSSFNRAAAAFNWVLGSAPEAYDKLASWVSGSPTTAASDWWTRNMVQPLDAQQQKELTLSPNAGFAEKATYQAGNLLGTLAQIVGTGGMGAPEAVAGAAMPSVAQAVGQAVTHGAQAMTFPSLTSAVNTGRDVYAKTGDIGAALRAAQMQYGVTTAGGIVPLAAPGGVLTRLATGAVSGAATVAGGNALMNTALPPSMQQPTTLDDLILGSLTNAIMGGVLGPRAAQPYDMAVRDTVTSSMKAQQAQGGYEALSQLSEAATASKTRGRDQAAFGQLVRNMTEGGDLQDLYVSARDLDGALQQAGINGTQLAEKLPDVASQLNEAIQTNGDVRIPVADYATHIAGGPADAALLPHLKTDPDGMTYQQSQDYMAGQQQAMTDQAAKIVSDKQAQDAQQAQSQAVYDQVLTQLNDTGRFSPDVNHGYAALARDFYSTTAARLGITPDELYQRYPLNVQGDALAQAGATMEQPAWHGSPYRGIENDGFQLNKIGTGEGAQAYGHGIYFAGDRGVAENYRNTLRADGFQIGDTGEVFNPDTLQHLNVRTLAREGNLEGAISKAREIAASDSPVASLAKEDLGVLESIKARGGLKENIGQLYSAEIPEDHQLLDWDKPLTEQPQGVQDGLRSLLTSDAVEQRALDDFDVSTRKELADKILDPKSTGAELYGSLSDVFRDERGASAALRDAGIPGLRYLDGVSRDKAEGTHNYVIWDEKHLGNDIKTYYQDGEAPRGAFQPSTNTIGLLKDADLSTFLHESGHFFLSTMRDIVARDDAPADMRRDMDALGKWYGGNADDIAREAAGYGASDTTADHVRAYLDAKTSGDGARDRAIDRALHEQFARGFEKYLFEGKAPSTELQPLFAQFRAWLVHVYQSITNLGVNLTPEVRGVFDRMLATDQAITDAEHVRGYKPLFDSPEAAGMTPEAYAEYRQSAGEATQEAQDELQARSLRDMRWAANAKSRELRKLQRDAAVQRRAVRDEVTKQVAAEPIERARAWLKTGEMTDGDGNAVKAEKGFRLNTDNLAEMYPDGMLARPDLDKLRGLTAKDGLHPDLVAEMFGFPSGDNLVRNLIDGEGTQSKIEGLTDATMLERHGDLTDPASMERAAEAAIHNEVRARFLATEFSALGKMMGSARSLAKAAKEAAEAAIAAKRVGDLRPAQYMAAEAKTGREAEQALARGDTQEAAAQKRAQLLNNRLYRAATDAVAETQKIITGQRRFDKASIRSKMDPDVLQQIDDLRARFDFRQNPPDGPAKEQVSLQKWVDSQKALGYTPYEHPGMMDPAVRKPYRSMTVEEMRGFSATIRSLEHIARERKAITVDGKRVMLDQTVDGLLEKMQARGEQFSEQEIVDPPRRGTDPLWQVALHRMASWLRTAGSEIKPQQYKANQFDQHEVLGPFARVVFNRIFDANYHKIDMLKTMSVHFQKNAESLGKDWQESLTRLVPNSTLVDVDLTKEAGHTVYRRLTRGDMLGIARHVGNESNFDKLTKGMEWRPEDVWQFLHENMSDKDWQATQMTWDAFDAHWPEMAEMNRRLGNTSPAHVEPRPFTTPAGIEMRGGYAPVDYDPIRSKLAVKKADSSAIDPADGLFGRGYFRADTTTNGSLNARIANYYDRLDLNFHGLERRLHDTVHDLAYREALVDVHKVLSDTRFRRQFQLTYGPEQYRALQQWVGDIANGPNADAQVNALTRIMESTRHAIVANGVALRVSTMLKHGGSALAKSSGYFSGGGQKYFTARAAQMATSHAELTSGAMEKFSEIRARAMQQDRDYRETTASLFEPESFHSKAERFGHSAVAYLDLLSAVPTAWAAYDRAITEGIPVNRGGTGQPMSEAGAVAYANQIVREAHGSNIESARSMLINNRSEGLRMFTTLYGFMNNSLGQALDMSDKLRTSGFSKPEVLARFLMATMVPGLVAGLVEGRDKAEGWAKWGAKAITGEVAGMIPFLRDAVGMIKGYPNAGLPPLLQTLAAGGKPFMDAWKAAHGKTPKHPIKDLGNALGLGIPGLGQISATAQYTHDRIKGAVHPQGIGDDIRGFLMGQEPH